MSTQVPTVLEKVDLPAGELRRRRDALPAPVQTFYRRVLGAFAQAGSPPAPNELTVWASELDLDLPAALRALADAELVFLDPAGLITTGGVPFAPGPTAHHVRIAGGPAVFANCAIDALGIGAMLDRDIEVHSTDPHTGQTVTAASRGGQWAWQPAGAVVFVGSSGAGRVTDTSCPVINFFADAGHAEAYQQQHGLNGLVLALPDAAEAGELIFRDLLRETPSST